MKDSHPLAARFHQVRRFVWVLLCRFNADGGPAGAGTISFFAVLSLIPLLLIAMAVLGYVLHDSSIAAQRVENYIAGLIPGANASRAAAQLIKDAEIQQRAEELVSGRGWAWVFGIFSLLWTASRIFANAIVPMNAAFNAPETRSFLQQQLISIALLLGAGFLFFTSLLASALPALLNKIPVFVGLATPLALLIAGLALVLSVTINALMFTLIYLYLPSPKAGVGWTHAVVGGSFVAVIWEMMKQGFAFYLSRFGGSDSYNRVYGSLGGLIILLLWIYYTSMLLLLGAELAQMFGEWRRERKRSHTDVVLEEGEVPGAVTPGTLTAG